MILRMPVSRKKHCTNRSGIARSAASPLSFRILGVIATISILIASNHDAAVVTSAMSTTVRLGTRPSPLAVTQTRSVAASIESTAAASDDDSSAVSVSIERLTPSGEMNDESQPVKIQNGPLAFGGVDFTDALDEAVLSGAIDAAVHSLKDLPPDGRWQRGNGLTIGYHSPRADPLDVLVGAASIYDLPSGARIGSSSVRRRAQLLAVRRDIVVVNVRGNVGARLAALDDGDDVDALVLAAAGLERLGLLPRDDGGKEGPIFGGRAWCKLPPSVMLPGAGQGIVAAVCRQNDSQTVQLLKRAEELVPGGRDGRIAAAAERAFLDALDGSTPWEGRPPVGALMMRELSDNDNSVDDGWTFLGLLSRPDGTGVLRCERSNIVGDISEGEAVALGREAAEGLLERAGSDYFSEERL